MEDNFRNALIIISAIIIAAIFIHGLWTIRKNKNPYKLKTNKTKVEPLSRDFDGSGFDQDGVSEVRVIKQTALTGEIDNPPSEEEIPHKPAPAPEYHDEPLPVDIEKESAPVDAEPTHEPMVQVDEPSIELTPPEAEPEQLSQPNLATEPETKKEESVYQEPVIQAKPSAQTIAQKSKSRTKNAGAKKNQFELNFDDALDEIAIDDPNEPTFGASENKAKVEIETEVLVVSVVMPEGHAISGAALLPSLLTLGMKFGDMDIFHRHQDNAGNGKVTFSLANMMNPGTFDLDNMENFTTQGISMFMTLPNAGDAFEVFEQMMAAAKQLGQEFHAQVLDDKRSVMTKQTEQHYVSKIREFERKSRIANA
ncbi:cell division protein ZipA [Thalassotalea sp. M1531]|uniref:Cell division protein ZipA n=2 Tax=Thalassotalea algicola TaxID=2716224 RepID=A0A7Y0LC25_9GAMM|nr:cell division protein ZipA [Thalassotalea algicola]